MNSLDIVSEPLSPIDRTCYSLSGLHALVSEALSNGMTLERLLGDSGVRAEQLLDLDTRLSLQQRVKIYRNVSTGDLPRAVGLAAGARQRLTDYAFYGFAMASSATFREAVEFAVQHLPLAGPTQRVHFHVEHGVAVLKSQDYQYLGDLLPFAAEFWRSSFNQLFALVLKRPTPTRLMTFPFKAPAHWRQYGQNFHCPVEFDADVLEWHLDESVLDQKCPDANPLTAAACRKICQQMMNREPGVSGLSLRIRTELLRNAGQLVSAREMARRMKISERSMFRRLEAEGRSYRQIVDEALLGVAQDYLRDRRLALDEVAYKLGYAESASFRRAFRRWTGTTPSHWRATQASAD